MISGDSSVSRVIRETYAISLPMARASSWTLEMELQCNKIAKELDRNHIDGWCALQSGYFCRLDHREQVEYLKNFWNWFRDTRTIL